MKTPIEWSHELYQKGSGLSAEDIAAIQADALDGLRDRFACAALTGLLADPTVPAKDADLDWLVGRAYTLADAMMVRRASLTEPA